MDSLLILRDWELGIEERCLAAFKAFVPQHERRNELFRRLDTVPISYR